MTKKSIFVRPRNRGECQPGGPRCVRPCPWATCRYHLLSLVQSAVDNKQYLTPKERRVPCGDLEPDDLIETCALDIADRGGCDRNELGRILRLSRESVRQFELLALRHARALLECAGWDDDDVGAVLDASSAYYTGRMLPPTYEIENSYRFRDEVEQACARLGVPGGKFNECVSITDPEWIEPEAA